MKAFERQYDLIRQTRELLFRYCETLAPEDYVKELESFGGDSIRNLHTHVAECYQVWLGNRALGESLPEITPMSINNVQEMREVFRETDALVHKFLNEFNDKKDYTVQVSLADGNTEFTALWLYTLHHPRVSP